MDESEIFKITEQLAIELTDLHKKYSVLPNEILCHAFIGFAVMLTTLLGNNIEEAYELIQIAVDKGILNLNKLPHLNKKYIEREDG